MGTRLIPSLIILWLSCFGKKEISIFWVFLPSPLMWARIVYYFVGQEEGL